MLAELFMDVKLSIELSPGFWRGGKISPRQNI
jgi:hypothetical protein